MKLVPIKKKSEVQISLTSLIDVILLLLIFFMLTSHFVQDYGMNLDLPESETGVSNETNNLKIVVTKNSEIFIDEKIVELSDISEYLSHSLTNKNVYLQADKEVTHGLVVKIMDAVKNTGCKKLTIATTQKIIN